MGRHETVIDLRTRETVVVDECDGTPIGGGRCIELPCATLNVPEFPEGACELRLCPTHCTPFVDSLGVWMDGTWIAYYLVWDR